MGFLAWERQVTVVIKLNFLIWGRSSWAWSPRRFVYFR